MLQYHPDIKHLDAHIEIVGNYHVCWQEKTTVFDGELPRHDSVCAPYRPGVSAPPRKKVAQVAALSPRLERLSEICVENVGQAAEEAVGFGSL